MQHKKDDLQREDKQRGNCKKWVHIKNHVVSSEMRLYMWFLTWICWSTHNEPFSLFLIFFHRLKRLLDIITANTRPGNTTIVHVAPNLAFAFVCVDQTQTVSVDMTLANPAMAGSGFKDGSVTITTNPGIIATGDLAVEFSLRLLPNNESQSSSLNTCTASDRVQVIVWRSSAFFSDESPLSSASAISWRANTRVNSYIVTGRVGQAGSQDAVQSVTAIFKSLQVWGSPIEMAG